MKNNKIKFLITQLPNVSTKNSHNHAIPLSMPRSFPRVARHHAVLRRACSNINSGGSVRGNSTGSRSRTHDRSNPAIRRGNCHCFEPNRNPAVPSTPPKATAAPQIHAAADTLAKRQVPENRTEAKGKATNKPVASPPASQPAISKATAAKTAEIGPRVDGGRLRHDEGHCLVDERWENRSYGEWRIIGVR